MAEPSPDAPVPVEMWRDAVNRLDLMEEQARSVLRTGGRMTSIRVARVEDPVSPLVLPDGPRILELASPGSMVLGPDGKPLS